MPDAKDANQTELYMCCRSDLVVGEAQSGRNVALGSVPRHVVTHKTRVQASERAQVRRRRAGGSGGVRPDLRARSVIPLNRFVPDIPVSPLPPAPGRFVYNSELLRQYSLIFN